jgi:AcrR family transcriptional regulator
MGMPTEHVQWAVGNKLKRGLTPFNLRRMRMKDARHRILETAYKLLMEVKDPDKVTVREVAGRAEVGIGLINYHFTSKDMMLMEAVGSALAEVATRWREQATDESQDPRQQLRQMLYELTEMGAEHPYLIKLAARFELTEGSINTPRFILPYVLRMMGHDEHIARLIAFSIISNIQSASIRNEAFREYSGFNLFLRKDRQCYIDLLIDSHIPGGGSHEDTGH